VSSVECRGGDRLLRSLAEYRTVKGLPLKPSTINGRVSSLRTFLDWLHDRGRLGKRLSEHLHHVKEPWLLPTSVLDHDQVKSVISVIDADTPEGLRDMAVYELLYSSGIRVGELERAKVSNLDLDNATLKVRGKGDKERIVPVGRTAIRRLVTWLRAGRPFLLGRGSEPCDALFLNAVGGSLKSFTVRRRLHAYAREAGIEEKSDDNPSEKRITPHTLRRSCTTEMVRADANLYHVKELLGHATLGTLKHYAKLNINDIKKTHEQCHPREKDEDE
jgi:site-specific recombinase XerD